MVIFHFRGYYEHMKRSFYARLLQKCIFLFLRSGRSSEFGKISKSPAICKSFVNLLRKIDTEILKIYKNQKFWKKKTPYQNHFRIVIFHFRGYYERMKRSFYARHLQQFIFWGFRSGRSSEFGKISKPSDMHSLC